MIAWSHVLKFGGPDPEAEEPRSDSDVQCTIIQRENLVDIYRDAAPEKSMSYLVDTVCRDCCSRKRMKLVLEIGP